MRGFLKEQSSKVFKLISKHLLYYYLWYNYKSDSINKNIHITNLLNPIKGANAGKNIMRKFNAHFSTIFIGKNVEIILFIDPNPINLSTTPRSFDIIFMRYFGIFFTSFFDFTFILLKNPLLSYIISRTSGGL